MYLIIFKVIGSTAVISGFLLMEILIAGIGWGIFASIWGKM